MNISEFIKFNKEMLGDFQNNEIKENLLVEAPQPEHLFIVHCMAMQTLLLNKAKGYKPLYIEQPDVPIEFLQSYVPSAQYVKYKKISKFIKLFIKIYAFLAFLKILIKGSALDFKFDGIKYGDILHDVYLSEYQEGTLQRPNLKLIKLIREIIKTHIEYKKLIKCYNIKAVLTSHKIGIKPGCLVRSALKCKCKVYTSNGMHRNCLYKTNNKKEMKEYEYTPTRKEMTDILSLDEETFNKEYERIHNLHLYGNATCDVKYAYSDDNTMYKTREEFNNKYNLDNSKKNIFIMLHAFTDHPHTHFEKMIFKDYGDWFLRTLDYAKTHNHVNWIFKQHPSDKFYPTKDIIFSELFKNTPSNIVFLSSDDKVDTRSLENTADAIITCLGSAGFEIPAFYGIPSYTAGDNPYIGYAFSKNAENQKDYFNILDNLDKVQKLTPQAQKEAKAMYMFIYGYSAVDYSFIPILSFEDHHDPELNNKLFDKIANLYNERKDIILNQIARYSFEISRSDFKALRTKNYMKYEDYLSFPFDVSKPMPDCKIDIMKEGCQILKDLNIPYCLADGTLLGVYRDNRLIPHDTDIDITVILPADIDAVIREFTRHGFSIGRLPISYGEVQQIVFYKNETLFDIIFYEKIGDKALNFCEKDFYFEHNINFYGNFKPFMFENFEFYIPEDTEGWLAHTYGEDWRQPKPKPKDWRQENSYLGAYDYNGDRKVTEQQKMSENQAILL